MIPTSKVDATLDRLAAAYADHHPALVARVVESASLDEASEFLASASRSRAIEILRRLTPTTASGALTQMDVPKAGRLLSKLDLHRAAAILAGMDDKPQQECIEQLDPELAQELRALMAFPAGTAGSLMDPRVTTFRPDALVRDVIPRLREIRRRRLQDVFLVDEDDHLVGSVGLADVILAAPDDRLDEIADLEPPRVTAFAPREEIMETLENRRVRSLPVVDFEGRILGVLRQNELIQAARQATSTNLVTMVGAGRDERALSPALFAVRKRLPWLEINLVTAFLAAAVVGLFEDIIARNTALAILLPVVAGQSGNTGAQALAVTMRGLALREVRLHQWIRISLKELTVGAVNGVAVAITTGVAVFLWSRSWGLALVIASSMIVSMTAAGLSGAVIPMLLTRLGQDPAQSSSIVLTTVTDVVGFFSFLGIATLLSRFL